MSRPSPWLASANVLAALALFFSVGGASVSEAAAKRVHALLSGQELKAATITSREVKDSSLLARDFRRGELPRGSVGENGERGGRGPQGLVGPAGEPGEQGADGEAAPADAAAHTPSLRSLGGGALQAAAGNDPRLSDARVPSGAAGGDLAGSYPSPTIRAGAVGSAQLAAAPSWIAPSLSGSWVNFDPLYNTAVGYHKDHLGVVHLRGQIKDGAVPSAIFTLASGYRPATTHWFAAPSKNDLGYSLALVEVKSNGQVSALAGAPEHLSLDGIEFRTD